jgi:hypothetical protein
MNSNHNALNIVTKGLVNISNITMGLVYQLVLKKTKRKHGGSSADTLKVPPLYYEREPLYNEINKYQEDDIELIKVYVDWDKRGKVFKKIEAKLIEKHIRAEILNETSKNIKIELLKKPD